jgi:excisionase family DNA binding protein
MNKLKNYDFLDFGNPLIEKLQSSVRILNVKETSNLLGIKKYKVCDLIKDRKVVSMTIGNRPHVILSNKNESEGMEIIQFVSESLSFLCLEEASNLLKIPKHVIYRMIKDQELGSFKIGNKQFLIQKK